jgi:hypothetical protein
MHASIEAFFFDPEVLDDIARRHHDAYVNARPFPHVVFHDIVPDKALAAVAAEFPSLASRADLVRHHEHADKKRSFRTPNALGPHTRQLLSELNSSVFLTFLEQLSGIAGLLPDPHFTGGGLHQIERGGFLQVHADFNRLDRLSLDRRMNLLLYLNEDWEDAWGGELELWTPDMSACAERVKPTFGTCVIFNTTDDSYHGHPEPLDCPPDRSRNSMALYYYSSGARPEITEPHGTLWQRRPGAHQEAAWQRWLPPVAIDGAQRARRRYRKLMKKQRSDKAPNA